MEGEGGRIEEMEVRWVSEFCTANYNLPTEKNVWNVSLSKKKSGVSRRTRE